MIYKYGLNFKISGLDKFPDNTKKLHAILESSIHPIENIYGMQL